MWVGWGLLAGYTRFSGWWTLLHPSVTSRAPCFSPQSPRGDTTIQREAVPDSGTHISCVVLDMLPNCSQPTVKWSTCEVWPCVWKVPGSY